MESEHEETSVTLGIRIPIDSSRNHRLIREDRSADDEQSDIWNERLQFSNLIRPLDPNLGIMGQLPPSEIINEKSTLNSWNVEPHFLHLLPLSPISSENSILIIGGINPSSISKKIPPDIDDDDLVLGSTIFQYILDSGIWRYYGTMTEPRCYHACALDGHYLYITGGYSLLKRKHGEMIAISSTDRLNLIDKQWKSCTNMIMPRAAHALVSHKGYLYAFGGRNSQGSILASVEMYDPQQDFWIEITSLPRPTMGLAATCIMDSVWLIGGITDHTSKNPTECLLSDVFSFIPSVRKWCEEVPLPYACAFSSCISNDYALWLIGGFTASGISEEEDITSCCAVLQFSLSENPKWKMVASLLYPRHALNAVLHDEYIYVLGGVESSSKCTSDKVEMINIIGNVSHVCTKMPVPIAGCTSILIIPEKDTMSEKEKTGFHQMAEKDKKRYESEMANYKPSDKAKGKGGMRKRTKDPNAPKRARSAFFWFSNDERAKVKETMQGVIVADVAKELRKRWNEASDDVRAKYEALAAKDKACYSKDKNVLNDAPGESKIITNEDYFPDILIIGGEYSNCPIESRFILSYNCDEDVWSHFSYMLPEYRIYHSAVFVNNKIYIIELFLLLKYMMNHVILG